MVPTMNMGQQLEFKEVSEEVRGQGRQFFYEVADVSIASRDFESVYKMDTSNMFKSMITEK